MSILGISINNFIELSIILTSIIGALWAFYKLRKMRSLEQMLEIDIFPEIIKGKTSNIIDISIIFKNVGKVAIWANAPFPGCTLEIKKVPDGMDDSNQLWTDPKLELLFPPIQYIGEWKELIIEPNEANIMHVLITTKYDGIVAIKASFVPSRIKEKYTWDVYKIIDLRKN